jgi:hypothetical protein
MQARCSTTKDEGSLKQPFMKLKVRFKLERLHPTLSIIVPAAVRWIPEAQFPYPIGFDTPLYLAMGKNYISNPTPFRLFVIVLGALYLLKVDLLAAMKVLPTLTYCLLGFATFRFAKKYLGWSSFASLLASISLPLSVAMLRMSWDMHKLTLGIALLLLTLSYWRELDDRRGKFMFSMLSFFTFISHELVTVTYLATLLFLLREDRSRLLTYANFMFGLTLFLAWYGAHPETLLGWICNMLSSKPLSNFTSELSSNGGLLVKLYSLYTPFIIAGAFRDKAVNLWIAFYLLGSLSTVISPSFLLGGVPPWRYALLLTIPLSLHATRGVIALTEKVRMNPVGAILLILLMNTPAFSFLGITNFFTFYEVEGIIPSHMAQTSIPLSDIKPTINLMGKVNGGTVLVYGDFVGWVEYYANARVIGFGGTYGATQTLEQALNLAKNGGDVYLLFWDDSQAERLSFKVVAAEGRLKLYKYLGSA